MGTFLNEITKPGGGNPWVGKDCCVKESNMGLDITRMYNSDAEAAAADPPVEIGEEYYAGSAHVEGAVHGTRKVRTV